MVEFDVQASCHQGFSDAADESGLAYARATFDDEDAGGVRRSDVVVEGEETQGSVSARKYSLYVSSLHSRQSPFSVAPLLLGPG
jgi:hypothetical protein